MVKSIKIIRYLKFDHKIMGGRGSGATLGVVLSEGCGGVGPKLK